MDNKPIQKKAHLNHKHQERENLTQHNGIQKSYYSNDKIG